MATPLFANKTANISSSLLRRWHLLERMDYVMAYIVLAGGVAVHSLNKPMASATFLLPLFILIQLYSVAAYTYDDYAHGHGNATASSFCQPDQAAALLQLKQSFIFDYSTTTLPSWQTGIDCCLWEGVGCDSDVYGGGHVTALDLGGRGLYSYGCNSALFNLTSLRYLDLSMNDFGGSQIPAAGFERLFKLTHLNLSHSGFYGQIPITISKLTGLNILDFSSLHDSYALLGGYNNLMLQEPSFETLLANLTNLRELYIDGVDISSSEGWCSVLSDVTPHLEVLSMSNCQLHGPINSSLGSLKSLTVINLEYNDFSDWFPQRIFQLKNIRVLDVSGNYQLSGHLPESPYGTSLETFNIHYTNFSSIKLSSFSSFLTLRTLGIDGMSISMESTGLLFNQLNSLQNLQLSTAHLLGELGPFISWISTLKNLTSLTLDNYWSSKRLPPSIGNLTNLISLEIFDADFFGEIPPSIGNLTKLISLKISNCGFSGTIPSSIGNLKKLRSLEISDSGLSGRITTEIGHLSKLKVLVLKSCRFSGRTPSIIANLTQLVYLDLSHNDLRGEIPTSLYASPAMLRLDLSSNQLSGPIQEFRLTSLVYLDLSSNQLSGVIPELGGLTSLVDLNLRSNDLTGLVQLSSLCKLRRLTSLVLSDNRLSVLDGEGKKSTVPLLPKLLGLELASCNMTIIPRFLMHVNHVQILDLSNNKIRGAIPKWIWETFYDSLRHLNLSHNMFTYMQLSTYVPLNSRLEYLDLSFNRLQGMIPMLPMTNLTRDDLSTTIFLDYSNNRFSSVMANFTAYLGQTAYLRLSKNNINGHIPNSLCDSKNLNVLDLSYNNFSGLIPSCLIEDGSLLILSLRENNFEGTLPNNIREHCNLQTVDLYGNKMQGQLPRSLSNCVDLEVLDIGNNQMVDTFPSWMGRLSDLRVLILRSNQFYGSLGYLQKDRKFGKYFSKLQIFDIASNNFSGNLDPLWFERFEYMMAKFNNTGNILEHQMWYASYYHDVLAMTYKGQYMTIEKILTALIVIDLSNNALDGDIPKSIGRLVSLHILNMSHNAFTGRIPPQIGETHELESLDLSWNKLYGKIPQELTDLTFLGTLNLGENMLEGSIPRLRQFATFDNTSYKGNAELCGPPLSKPCGNLSNPNEAQVNISRDHVDVILFLFVGVGFGVGFTAGLLVKWSKICKCFRIM